MAARVPVAVLRAQGRLRPFEGQAHLDVLEHTLENARARFEQAGVTSVRAAAADAASAAVAGRKQPAVDDALVTALAGELARLYALGYQTVESELHHQRTRQALPIGLGAAPAPPHLRKAKGKKGPRCGSCEMHDPAAGVCWGYGNYPVRPGQLCDSYEPATAHRQLAAGDQEDDRGSIARRALLAAQAVWQAVWQAVAHAVLGGQRDSAKITAAGEQAGDAALRHAALRHASGVLNAGRSAAAEAHGDEIVGARYTAVLDQNTCVACALADDGVLRSLSDPVRIDREPPNPDCAGGGQCRCLEVFQLVSETPASDQAVGPGVLAFDAGDMRGN